MNFGELKTYLRALINRKDITDALAAQFIQQAQDRLERWPQVDPSKSAPRPSFMQKFVSFILDADSDEAGAFTVPADFLELIDFYSGSTEMERVDMSKFVQIDDTNIGTPRYFLQTGHTIRMRPIPLEDTTLYLRYYGTQPQFVTDEDENAWSVSCVDALIFGAAELAAYHYEDDRLGSFQAKFLQSLSELQDQSLAEDFSGPMRIQPAYSYPCEDY